MKSKTEATKQEKEPLRDSKNSKSSDKKNGKEKVNPTVDKSRGKDTVGKVNGEEKEEEKDKEEKEVKKKDEDEEDRKR